MVWCSDLFPSTDLHYTVVWQVHGNLMWELTVGLQGLKIAGETLVKVLFFVCQQMRGHCSRHSQQRHWKLGMRTQKQGNCTLVCITAANSLVLGLPFRSPALSWPCLDQLCEKLVRRHLLLHLPSWMPFCSSIKNRGLESTSLNQICTSIKYTQLWNNLVL